MYCTGNKYNTKSSDYNLIRMQSRVVLIILKIALPQHYTVVSNLCIFDVPPWYTVVCVLLLVNNKKILINTHIQKIIYIYIYKHK